MTLINILLSVVKDQQNKPRRNEVDITLVNGNILLRSFHIYEIDVKEQMIKGLTPQEEYAHVREGREPVFCFLRFSEIKELAVPDLGVEYAQFALASC